ncbi:MAG: 50S ribosomal protein L1 [Candidatus Lambdaproteobacteria bacterium RIFOXYD12_FULL_49_8]|uniref:Large ribosomal subunit protein uL1 n=1 Tax=Candidatus Lambdaproteobacteria bacterium RIFOXYD2_FULL_50_16 TaxID=1817772 RepID=A0A1F6GBR2_9PROT|nr:MAG: 50S ribosomal protein L1 [Candidatus Lambdaproteobacteria bacterium RIFOXYD2_FULL_50_16]OGG96358.1 MAG: 50S ribosomal protein L1 [Candidatus Lambdaproteobacteria bacterium RIFOXYD12_FULL_49_8]
MPKISKRKKAWLEEIDRESKYSIDDALALVKKYASSKFTEKVDVAIRLGIDPRKSDQMVRGSVVLPHGTGQVLRVLVFARGDKAKEATEAGAEFVGGEELAEKIQSENWFEFDRVVATPDMMVVVGKIGKLLGPKGLMPNPKVGTVTTDVAKAVNEIKKGQVQFRTDKGANIHSTCGLATFSEAALKENIKAIYDQLVKLKPSSAKGVYIKNIAVSSTMGPGVRVDEKQFS